MRPLFQTLSSSVRRAGWLASRLLVPSLEVPVPARSHHDEAARGELDGGLWRTVGQNPALAAAEVGVGFDERNNRFVAFGGAGPNGHAFGDTWSILEFLAAVGRDR